MSIISSFVGKEFIKGIEVEFCKHGPEVQDLIIKEVEGFAKDALEWVGEKIAKKSNAGSDK